MPAIMGLSLPLYPSLSSPLGLCRVHHLFLRRGNHAVVASSEWFPGFWHRGTNLCRVSLWPGSMSFSCAEYKCIVYVCFPNGLQAWALGNKAVVCVHE